MRTAPRQRVVSGMAFSNGVIAFTNGPGDFVLTKIATGTYRMQFSPGVPVRSFVASPMSSGDNRITSDTNNLLSGVVGIYGFAGAIGTLADMNFNFQAVIG